MSEITQTQKTALLKIPGFKDIQKQYAKESKMTGSGKRRMKGRGFWDDVGNWFSQAGKDINQFLKDTKIVSNIAAYALPILGSMGAALLTVNPLGAVAGGIAGKSAADFIRSQGYGMKMKGGDSRLAINLPNQRMRPAKMKGKGILDVLQPLATFTGNAGALSIATQQLQQLEKIKKMSGKGGLTFGYNGAITPNLMGKGMKGMHKGGHYGSGGSQYNIISSEFGQIKV
jgi:hypothetical protein